MTGKSVLAATYASRTINHQLSVLFGFYEWACASHLGPLVNPVPAQRGRRDERLHGHHNPMEDFVVHRRAYRQKTPRPIWRAMPADAADALFPSGRCTAAGGSGATVCAGTCRTVAGRRRNLSTV